MFKKINNRPKNILGFSESIEYNE